jgi:hypothetical protein
MTLGLRSCFTNVISFKADPQARLMKKRCIHVPVKISASLSRKAAIAHLMLVKKK